jgi:ribosomal protein S18 acetylase RimI-like enzyme
MKSLTVDVATAADEAAVVDVLMLAFSSDPATRWTWPDPTSFLAAFPRFARAFGGAAFAQGSAFRVGSAGVALWLPPGIGPDEQAMFELMQATADPAMHADGMQVMQQMTRYHPAEPHWYLPLTGVDPFRQGQGVGGALLRHAAAIFDRDGALAYLESSNPRNIPLYQRHGFEVLGAIQVGGSPTITPMLRRPGRRG